MPEEAEQQANYTQAGVDIDAAGRALELIKSHVRATQRPEVISDLGFFAGLFQLSNYRQPVLVASADGVGTKLKIASALAKHDTIGIDLVNHCVNDILTCGAEPLFFLDYVAVGKLVPQEVEAIVRGLAVACGDVGCALLGGETAEMPGIYAEGDFDLVGFIVGVVEREHLLTGESIQAGDAILGLPSSGLHTNGYSLVRHIFGTERPILNKFYPGLGRTLGEELLEPHRCYYKALRPLLAEGKIKGLAHITGGGLIDNPPRPLSSNLAAGIRRGSWEVPAIFRLIQKEGNVAEQEMYRVFNMGVGMAVYCSPADVDQLLSALPGSRLIGEVVARRGDERVLIA